MDRRALLAAAAAATLSLVLFSSLVLVAGETELIASPLSQTRQPPSPSLASDVEPRLFLDEFEAQAVEESASEGAASAETNDKSLGSGEMSNSRFGSVSAFSLGEHRPQPQQPLPPPPRPPLPHPQQRREDLATELEARLSKRFAAAALSPPGSATPSSSTLALSPKEGERSAARQEVFTTKPAPSPSPSPSPPRSLPFLLRLVSLARERPVLAAAAALGVVVASAALVAAALAAVAAAAAAAEGCSAAGRRRGRGESRNEGREGGGFDEEAGGGGAPAAAAAAAAFAAASPPGSGPSSPLSPASEAGGEATEEEEQPGGIDVPLISPQVQQRGAADEGEEEEAAEAAAAAAEPSAAAAKSHPPPAADALPAPAPPPPPPHLREVRSAPPFPRASACGLPGIWPALMTPDDAAEAWLAMEEAAATTGGTGVGMIGAKRTVFSFDPTSTSSTAAAAAVASSSQRQQQQQQRRRPFSAIRAVHLSSLEQQQRPAALALVSNPAFEVSERGGAVAAASAKATKTATMSRTTKTAMTTTTPTMHMRPPKRKQQEENGEEEEDAAAWTTPSAATAAAVGVHRSHFVSPVPSSTGSRAKGSRSRDNSAGARPATSCSPDALVALESRRRELQEALIRLREAKRAREALWVEEEDEEEEEEEPRPRAVPPPTPLRV